VFSLPRRFPQKTCRSSACWILEEIFPRRSSSRCSRRNSRRPLDPYKDSAWPVFLCSIHAFEPHHLRSIVFSQDNADGAPHTLIIDEIRIDGPQAAKGNPPLAPRNIRAKGYERHVDISWDAVAATSVERYIVYRRLMERTFSRSARKFAASIATPTSSAKPDQRAFYKVAASDRRYRQSRLSEAVSASTKQLTDDELLPCCRKKLPLLLGRCAPQLRHDA